MTLKKLRNELGVMKEYGFNFTYLRLERPLHWKSESGKIRTPFGMCQIYIVDKHEDKLIVSFIVSRYQLETYLQQQEKALRNVCDPKNEMH